MENRKKRNKTLIGASLILLVISAVIFTSLALLFADEGKKGIVTQVKGSVKKRPLDTKEWQRAKRDTEISNGDKVRTYKASRAELKLLELDIIRMAPRTTIDIVKLYEETKEKRRNVKIHLKKGELWVNVSKKGKRAQFDITNPVTAMAITGTTLRIAVGDDSTTLLKVYKGEVQITNAPEQTNLQPKSIEPYEIPGPHEVPGPYEVSVEQWMYIVKSMQQIKVDNKGQIVSQGAFNRKDLDEQSDWVKWNRQRDRMLTK